MIDIYGTLGPSCSSKQVLVQMFRAGMTGIRLNLSHVSLRESGPLLEVFHEAAKEAGVKPLLLIDMQGPELRIGSLKKPVLLSEGENVILSCAGNPAEDPAGAPVIPIPEVVFRALDKGRGTPQQVLQQVLLDDGRILLEISDTDIYVQDGMAAARVVRGGELSGRKSIKVVGADVHPPTMTEADLQNIRDAASFGVTGIMQPFVRSRQDLEEVRRALIENGADHLQLVAKIENRDGIRQLDSLLPACDAICIARGDLGNDMNLWELPAEQKRIELACREAGKYFMVATQMLSSMETRAVPTRAEVNDIFNTVADGASGVMVTGETAVGKYPVEVIRFLAETAREGEVYRNIG